ncbi:LOW QUALITY PROTEIN: taste receptor type 2 member 1 [Lutra lutra]|uniref:LOW QUALITY PROTEIN: taste receptor type 2 member 1 n=1 Tax=Lutra lutra TaxID=9657 RepID=UPI001FD28B7E|nr:LOW QUALITY PROTEIN: taste receptor type 2 member 1 [Lutra lutra]
MLEYYLIIPCLFSTIQFLIEVLANGLILVVNGTELIKQRKMVPLALLLSCLAIARICLQSVIFDINLALLLWIKVPLLTENFLILMFVNELGLWFASWLGVFYCAKIAPIAHLLFFWLKMRILKLVPWLILGSLLYASAPSVFYNKHTGFFPNKFFGVFFSPNTTTQIKEKSALQIAFLVRLSLPLFIFLMSALLLIFSLGRHTWQMRNTAMGTRVPSTGVHVRSLLSVLSFLVLCISHYVTAALLSSQIFKLRSLMFLFCVWVFGSFPSGHSMILILGSPKLKQNAKKLLLHGKCHE